MALTFAKSALTLAIGTMLATSAVAGGFLRGTADTDILYEDGPAALRTGLVYVVPSRDYDTIRGEEAHDKTFSDQYSVPFGSVKIRLFDALSCAGTYTRPFGASTFYGPQAQLADLISTRNATSASEFRSDEFGATCDAHVAAGPGNIHFLGGLFVQDFDYEERTTLGTLRLTDNSATGYRLGAAYDIPEYAFRAQVLFRSQIDHEADGEFELSALGSGFAKQLTGLTFPAGTPLPTTGAGSLPKSLKVSLQSGIAPGWLAYGSVEWMDWSVLPSLNYYIEGLGPQQKNFNFRDGWTVQGGIGHSFTEKLSGTVNLTWDRGVSTGADIMSDTWTLGLGAQIKAGPGAIRLGGGLTYLTAGSQQLARGASFDAESDGDWAVGLTTSYLLKF